MERYGVVVLLLAVAQAFDASSSRFFLHSASTIFFCSGEMRSSVPAPLKTLKAISNPFSITAEKKKFY